ncbi:C40 family peptidase [Alteribacter keqinensis]|uniref:NlpC/P60 domain-containing protein n=1 Tax=Alteribacter keqinensis TaxID=2483800 RepID=A0A3M7TX89_9BACI|nr:NlpC/P60 family protein [Alteribacter keqinensis]RNA69512.1 hypothetical protein EBO34_06135 [Alteribacter keqinensis]
MSRWLKRNKWMLLFWTGIFVFIVLLFRPWQMMFDDNVSEPASGGSGDLIRDYGELDPDVENILAAGESLLGTPFLSGGRDPDEGFNSSGFVQYVYQESTGIRMPRIAAHQHDLGEEIKKEDLYPGDLVFFEAETVMSGIYTGNGEFLTVSSTNGVEKVSLARDTFWSRHFIGGKRLTKEEMQGLHPGTYTEHSHPAVREAVQYLDTPYVFGGNTLNGFDCSFFIQDVFRESSDIYLPRVTKDQYELGEEIDKKDLKPGDVLFFAGADGDEDDPRSDWDVNHTGIYAGGNFMIHASRTEGMTQVSYLNEYWDDAFTGIRRYDDMSLNHEHPVVQEAASHLFSEDFTTPGFVRHVYRKSLGITLPQRAEDQWNSGSPVERDDLEIGDVLFFEGTNSYLAALYTGHDLAMFVSASSGVTTRHLEYDEFFSENYLGARRYD